MLKWEPGTPVEPDNCCTLESDGVTLYVRDHDGKHKRWQGLVFSTGVFSDESHDSCCVTGPAEAIAKARALLDELEAKVEEPNTPVASATQIQ